MNEEISEWAARLAGEVAPDEADLAPDIAAAFLAGGKDRAQLFRTSASVPGGFDVGAVLVIFPFALSAISAASAAVQALLSSGALSVPGAVNDLLDLRDRTRRRAGKEPASEPPQAAYLALNRVIEVIEADLGRAGLGQDERELLAYRIVRHLLDDPRGTVEFLAATGEAVGRPG